MSPCHFPWECSTEFCRRRCRDCRLCRHHNQHKAAFLRRRRLNRSGRPTPASIVSFPSSLPPRTCVRRRCQKKRLGCGPPAKSTPRPHWKPPIPSCRNRNLRHTLCRRRNRTELCSPKETEWNEPGLPPETSIFAGHWQHRTPEESQRVKSHTTCRCGV